MTSTVHELVLAGGLLVDGTGVPPRPADVAVDGGRITAIGQAGTLRGTSTKDVTGKVVTPGFFDIHSHADFTVLAAGRADSAVAQGVTSLVTGNCGYGVAPVTAQSQDLACLQIPGWRPERLPSYSSFGEYLELLRDRGTGVNVFPLLAHGPLRLAVVGAEERPATRSEIAELGQLAKEAMQAGAVGFSTGLEYAPGTAATESELAAISVAVGEFAGMYATHCRNRSEAIEAAVDEAVSVAEAGGCRLQLSHFLPRPALAGGERYRRAVDRSRTAEVPVRFDAFPFEHGPTPLAVLLPTWVRQGTRADVADRLSSARLRAQIVEQFDDRFGEAVRSGVADEMYLISDGGRGSAVGRRIGEVRAGRSVQQTVVELLADAGESFGSVTVLERWASPDDLLRALAAGDYFIMGDGVTRSAGSSDGGFSLSDWAYAPRMLASYVRDLGLVPLADAVHRMTMAPARQAGVTDRGAVLPGSAADLVVLDLDQLDVSVDPADLGRPPVGIEQVLVNGRHAVADGHLTGALAGQVGVPR